MLRAFRYPLKLNQQEIAGLEDILLACQRLYNAGLEQRIDAYRKQKKSFSNYDQHLQLTELRAVAPEYKAVGAIILRSSLDRLHRAYSAFFRRIKAGQTPGFPRFKSRDRYTSFSFPKPVIKGNFLSIPGYGKVRLHLYRPLKGTPLQAHIKKTARGWEASIVCDLGEAPVKTPILTSTGIDVGLNSFAVLSDGTEISNPRFYRKSEAHLARAQKALSSKRRGSNSRKRAKRAVGVIHQHICNQRLDFCRKLSKQLVSQFDLISIEKLNIKGMIRSNLAKSISDASWGQFAACLNFKAEEAGKTITAVDPRNTSQLCSGCGTKVPKTLAERIHKCPSCNLELTRDHNAALNILALGLRAAERISAKAGVLAEV
jgi:putative transposase